RTLTTTRKDEERCAEIIIGDKGIFEPIHEGKEAVIILTMYKNETDQGVMRLSKNSNLLQKKEPSVPHHTINLQQLSLPIVNGDPRLWREFWSSFNIAVNSQAIPEIQKYLVFCLKGNVLQAVRGYDIVPENYEVIRRVLTEEYGESSTITKFVIQ
uniref:KIND domain-containing protein n=1 Tax=Loa loa TaxID=7209 RepID=A0A1I7VYK8_LOALO